MAVAFFWTARRFTWYFVLYVFRQLNDLIFDTSRWQLGCLEKSGTNKTVSQPTSHKDVPTAPLWTPKIRAGSLAKWKLRFRRKLQRIGHSPSHFRQASSTPAERLANTVQTTDWLPKIIPLIAKSPSVYNFFLCPASLYSSVPFLFRRCGNLVKMESPNSHKLGTALQCVLHKTRRLPETCLAAGTGRTAMQQQHRNKAVRSVCRSFRNPWDSFPRPQWNPN